ncbi:UNVERIFIED_CONTAM: hypothetical protein NCL1_31773 [Trichonephila clavipes]
MDEDEDNNSNESSKGPSIDDAFSALETAVEWYEQQSECCPTQLLLLKRIRDLASEKRRYTIVQRKISDYFPQYRYNCNIFHLFSYFFKQVSRIW